MNDLESALLEEITNGEEPRLLIRTRTRIDAGRWWRPTAVWLCITARELILFAVARRRYTERIPLSDCINSHYAHSSGELVIDPAEALHMKHVKLSPREALDTIDFLTHK